MKQKRNTKIERISRRELERILSRIQQPPDPKSAIREKEVGKREPYSVRGFK